MNLVRSQDENNLTMNTEKTFFKYCFQQPRNIKFHKSNKNHARLLYCIEKLQNSAKRIKRPKLMEYIIFKDFNTQYC